MAESSMSSSKAPPPPPSSPGPRHRPTEDQKQKQNQNRSPSSPRPGILRRQSTQDRINGILETGLERAETLHQRSPHLYPLSRGQSAPAPRRAAMDNESSADETTGIIAAAGRGRRADGRHVNYQSTVQQDGGRSSLRSRRTNNTSHDLSRESSSSASRVLPPPAVGGPHDGGGAANGGGGDRDGREDDAGVGGESLWRRVWANFQSIELENKGSVARDHLALERTFLAWLRTSLAFASIGVAITQLFRLNTSLSAGDPAHGGGGGRQDTLRHVGKPLGVTFLAISILMLFLGYKRYLMSQKWIMRGKFPASRGTVMLVTLVACGLMVASLVVVIVVPPQTVER